jgi:hypothetical protein
VKSNSTEAVVVLSYATFIVKSNSTEAVVVLSYATFYCESLTVLRAVAVLSYATFYCVFHTRVHLSVIEFTKAVL